MRDFPTSTGNTAPAHQRAALARQQLPEGVRPKLLHEIFEAKVDEQAQAPAIFCRDLCSSYAEVEAKANSLARALREGGLETGALVGLYLQRSQWPLIAILAVLKAGAAYVPLDPSHPDTRVRDILTDAQITTVITELDLSGADALVSRELIIIDSAQGAHWDYPSTRISAQSIGLEPHHLCYVLYTSGSTGRPKGVMTEHRNVVHFVAAFDEICQMRPDDRVYHGFSLGFDGSVEEMWMAWNAGACLVVGTDDICKLGSEVAALIEREKVTFFSTVPTFLSLIPHDLPSLRLLIVSGEACPADTVNRWARPGRRMLNVYGPTECTVNTTSADCRAHQPVTIGRPLRGYELHILDTQGQPVSKGEAGELYIGGPGVARGYLNRQTLTREQFVAADQPTQAAPEQVSAQTPSSLAIGQRLYRTGDRVQWDSQGELRFLGRLDSQVKIRGYRVELAEIESILLERDEIRAAVVHVQQDDTKMQQLVAYVVPSDGTHTIEILADGSPAT